MKREYGFGTRECTRTATEIVDMQRQCSETRWTDCLYAAAMYLWGCGVAQSGDQAEALYQQACRFGSMLGCTMAGIRTKDFDRGIAVLERPCALGHLQACGYLGVQLYNRGHEEDIPRAAELLERACRAGWELCGALAQVVSQWKLEPRYAATRALLEHACKEREWSACSGLAQSLDKGYLGTVDHERAAALHTTTCYELQHMPSCNELGYMLALGRGVEKDPRRGTALFYRACHSQYAPACDSLGEATEKGWAGPASPENALPFYDRGCALGEPVACQNAKRLRATGVVAPEEN